MLFRNNPVFFPSFFHAWTDVSVCKVRLGFLLIYRSLIKLIYGYYDFVLEFNLGELYKSRLQFDWISQFKPAL